MSNFSAGDYFKIYSSTEHGTDTTSYDIYRIDEIQYYPEFEAHVSWVRSIGNVYRLPMTKDRKVAHVLETLWWHKLSPVEVMALAT